MDPSTRPFIPGNDWKSTKGSLQAIENPSTSLDERSEKDISDTVSLTTSQITTVPPEGLACPNRIEHGDNCRVLPSPTAYRGYHDDTTTLWPRLSCIRGFIKSSYPFQIRDKVVKQKAKTGTSSKDASAAPSHESTFLKVIEEMIEARNWTDDQANLARTLVAVSKGRVTESGEFVCQGDHFNLGCYISQGIKQRAFNKYIDHWSTHPKRSQGSCRSSSCVNSQSHCVGEESYTKDNERQKTDYTGDFLDKMFPDEHQKFIAQGSVGVAFEDDDGL